MKDALQSVRGMRDILTDESSYWVYLERVLGDVAQSYGYDYIKLPIIEKTNLFQRSIGLSTDIVSKEMYTFDDRNGESVTLRPEGTAGCVRAGLQHGLLYNQKQRYWYIGPMFRHERPQKGRFRQFEQFGVEAFGILGSDIDVEIILLGTRIWKLLGFDNAITLQINSLGSFDAREKYKEVLVDYLNKNKEYLDDDSIKRLNTNPLRILDSKNKDMSELIKNSPSLLNYIDDDSTKNFENVCKLLKELDIKYTIVPSLVRGLDYYNDTVFQWETSQLGSQGEICAGGRFDSLVQLLGGKPCSAVGFALGLDRVVSLMRVTECLKINNGVDIYIISENEHARIKAFALSEELRQKFGHLKIMTYCGIGSFKKQFKMADSKNATLGCILGEEEIANNTISVKFLSENIPQKMYSMSDFFDFIAKFNFKEGSN